MINEIEVEINYLKDLEERIRERRQYLQNQLQHIKFKKILEESSK